MLTMLTTTELENQENKVLGKALANIQQLFYPIQSIMHSVMKQVR